MIAKLSAEMEQLKKQLAVASLSVKEGQGSNDIETKVLELEAQNRDIAKMLIKKEGELEESRLQIKKLSKQIKAASEDEKEVDDEKEWTEALEEKDRLLEEKCAEIEELKLQWETERAELIKPALNQVNLQLEELKQTVRT